MPPPLLCSLPLSCPGASVSSWRTPAPTQTLLLLGTQIPCSQSADFPSLDSQAVTTSTSTLLAGPLPLCPAPFFIPQGKSEWRGIKSHGQIYLPSWELAGLGAPEEPGEAERQSGRGQGACSCPVPMRLAASEARMGRNKVGLLSGLSWGASLTQLLPIINMFRRVKACLPRKQN